MQPSETTPLLDSRQCSSRPHTESRTYQSALHEQEEDQHLLECQGSDENDENSLLSHNGAPKAAHPGIQDVSDSSLEPSPPGCKTVLFLVLLFSKPTPQTLPFL